MSELSKFEDMKLSRGMDTCVMGILNVTPDSFYDGGWHNQIDLAVAKAKQMVLDGAQVIDVGGESTRPGAQDVPSQEEINRVVPVIQRIVEMTNVPVSIDTTKASVAEAAVKAGAKWINDVSAGLVDPDILKVAAKYNTVYVAMHMRGTPRTMQSDTHYDNLIEEISQYFQEFLKRAKGAGIKRENIILDPGIGFGKSMEDNYVLLNDFPKFYKFDLPILIGASRKSFLNLIGVKDPDKRMAGTISAVSIATYLGAEIVRVHDVEEAVQAVSVAMKIRELSAGN